MADPIPSADDLIAIANQTLAKVTPGLWRNNLGMDPNETYHYILRLFEKSVKVGVKAGASEGTPSNAEVRAKTDILIAQTLGQCATYEPHLVMPTHRVTTSAGEEDAYRRVAKSQMFAYMLCFVARLAAFHCVDTAHAAFTVPSDDKQLASDLWAFLQTFEADHAAYVAAIKDCLHKVFEYAMHEFIEKPGVDPAFVPGTPRAKAVSTMSELLNSNSYMKHLVKGFEAAAKVLQKEPTNLVAKKQYIVYGCQMYLLGFIEEVASTLTANKEGPLQGAGRVHRGRRSLRKRRASDSDRHSRHRRRHRPIRGREDFVPH